jgi:hypothetical protein
MYCTGAWNSCAWGPGVPVSCNVTRGSARSHLVEDAVQQVEPAWVCRSVGKAVKTDETLRCQVKNAVLRMRSGANM